MVHFQIMTVLIIPQVIQGSFLNQNKKSNHLYLYYFLDFYLPMLFFSLFKSSKGSISRNNSGINLTGDSQIDADITAFINARKRIVYQMNKRNYQYL